MLHNFYGTQDDDSLKIAIFVLKMIIYWFWLKVSQHENRIFYKNIFMESIENLKDYKFQKIP